jgi:ABC-2 type transport system permease protein
MSQLPLLQPYWMQFRNHFKKSGNIQQTLKRDGLLLVVTFLLLGCIFAGTAMILLSVKNDLFFQSLIPIKLLELLCYAFFFLQFFGAVIAYMGNVYHSDSMNLHLSTPTSNAKLFLCKFIETFFETTFMFVVFTLPIALAYTTILDVPISFILCGALLCIPFLVIPNSLAFIVATLATYVTAVFWKRGFVLVIAVATTLVWVLSQVASTLKDIQLRGGGGNAIVHVISLFDNPNPHWLPSHWVSGILTSYLEANQYPTIWGVALLVATAAGSYAAAFLVFDVAVLRVRSRVFSHDGGGVTGNTRQKSDLTRKYLERFYHALPVDQPLRAIMLKDMTSLFRDKSQSLKLLMYLGIAASYLLLIKFMSSALILNIFGMSVWWAFLAGMNLLFGGFILTAIMTRLVYPSISMEGKAFWILNSAPIALVDLLRAKLFCWLPLAITLSISLLLAGQSIIHISVPSVLVTMFMGICMSIGCTALAIGLGAVFARFEWESTNQISAGLGTLVLFFSSLVFVSLLSLSSVAAYVVVIAPWNWERYGVRLVCAILAALILSALVSAVVTRVSCQRGALALAAKRR